MVPGCFKLVSVPFLLIALGLSLVWAFMPAQVALQLESDRYLSVLILLIDHLPSDG